MVDGSVAGEDGAAEQGGLGERDPRGAGNTQFAATTVSSAKAATFSPGCSSVPSASWAWTVPTPASAWVQSQTSPIRQWWHAPQDGAQLSTTPSPGATWVTPSPTARTVPAPSWPRTAGTGTRMVPLLRERSEWQTPAAASRTRT